MSDDEIDPAGKGRNWHRLQECGMMSLMEQNAKFRPVAGTADNKMENKMDTLWTPLARVFNMDNFGILEAIDKLPGSTLGRETFDGPACLRKYRGWQTKYRQVKKKYDVSDHIKAGQTGSEQDGENITLPGSMAAIDSATDAWHLFARFHALFGSKARFATGNHVDNLTPKKAQPPRKRLASLKPKATVEPGSGSEGDIATGDEVVPTKKRPRKLSSRQLDIVIDKTKEDKNETLEMLRTNTDRQIAALEKHDAHKAANAEKLQAMARVNAHVIELTSTGMQRSAALAEAMAAEQEFRAMF